MGRTAAFGSLTLLALAAMSASVHAEALPVQLTSAPGGEAKAALAWNMQSAQFEVSWDFSGYHLTATECGTFRDDPVTCNDVGDWHFLERKYIMISIVWQDIHLIGCATNVPSAGAGEQSNKVAGSMLHSLAQCTVNTPVDICDGDVDCSSINLVDAAGIAPTADNTLHWRIYLGVWTHYRENDQTGQKASLVIGLLGAGIGLVPVVGQVAGLFLGLLSAGVQYASTDGHRYSLAGYVDEEWGIDDTPILGMEFSCGSATGTDTWTVIEKQFFAKEGYDIDEYCLTVSALQAKAVSGTLVDNIDRVFSRAANRVYATQTGGPGSNEESARVVDEHTIEFESHNAGTSEFPFFQFVVHSDWDFEWAEERGVPGIVSRGILPSPNEQEDIEPEQLTGPMLYSRAFRATLLLPPRPESSCDPNLVRVEESFAPVAGAPQTGDVVVVLDACSPYAPKSRNPMIAAGAAKGIIDGRTSHTISSAIEVTFDLVPQVGAGWFFDAAPTCEAGLVDQYAGALTTTLLERGYTHLLMLDGPYGAIDVGEVFSWTDYAGFSGRTRITDPDDIPWAVNNLATSGPLDSYLAVIVHAPIDGDVACF